MTREEKIEKLIERILQMNEEQFQWFVERASEELGVQLTVTGLQ